jgi:hypothetical protein
MGAGVIRFWYRRKKTTIPFRTLPQILSFGIVRQFPNKPATSTTRHKFAYHSILLASEMLALLQRVSKWYLDLRRRLLVQQGISLHTTVREQDARTATKGI